MTDGEELELERAHYGDEPGARVSSRRVSPLLQLPVVLILAGKAAAGALAVLAIVTAWGIWSPTSEFLRNLEENQQVMTLSGARPATETQVAGWEDTRDYAVLYPVEGGDDAADLLSLFARSNTVWPATTAELYPLLDAAGALYIDAGAYEGPAFPHAVLPRLPITVNLNYLAKYPLLGEDHQPIAVDPAETAWVVAIPATYKSQQAEIEAYLQQLRTGGPDIVEGAFDFQTRYMPGYPPPESLRNQDVRIVWSEPGQQVFSFDSDVNRAGGNVIVDPIVQIMTPANSLPVDRMNMIGSWNSALKVFTGGDPAATYAALLSTLQELGVDDNLPRLVFANEAPLLRIDAAGAATRISKATAATMAAVMLTLGAAAAAMIVARLRRVLIVRRLHGFGAARRNRELILAAGISTAALAGLVGLALLADRAGHAPDSWRSISDGDLAAISLRLGAVVLALSAAELILALGLAAIIQRRTGALLVKQL